MKKYFLLLLSIFSLSFSTKILKSKIIETLSFFTEQYSPNKEIIAKTVKAPHEIGSSYESYMGDNILLINAKTNIIYAILTGHKTHIAGVAFSSDGSKIVSISYDGTTYKMWDTKTGQCLNTINLTNSDISLVDFFSPNGEKIILSCEDEDNYSRPKHKETLSSFIEQYSPNKEIIAKTVEAPHKIGSSYEETRYDENILLINAKTNIIYATLTGHKEQIADVVFSPDGSKIASPSYDGTTKIWDTKTGKCLLTIIKPMNFDVACHQADFSSNGKKIVIAYFRDNYHFKPYPGCPEVTAEAAVYDATTGTLLKKLTGHTGAIIFTKFVDNGNKIVTAAYDDTVKIWDANTGKCLNTVSFENDYKIYRNNISFSDDKENIIIKFKVYENHNFSFKEIIKTKIWNIKEEKFI